MEATFLGKTMGDLHRTSQESQDNVISDVSAAMRNKLLFESMHTLLRIIETPHLHLTGCRKHQPDGDVCDCSLGDLREELGYPR